MSMEVSTRYCSKASMSKDCSCGHKVDLLALNQLFPLLIRCHKMTSIEYNVEIDLSIPNVQREVRKSRFKNFLPSAKKIWLALGLHTLTRRMTKAVRFHTKFDEIYSQFNENMVRFQRIVFQFNECILLISSEAPKYYKRSIFNDYVAAESKRYRTMAL